jgi:photosystem II stability/assembly factor-like uncharacterized protein
MSSLIAVLVASATAVPVWTWENPLPHGGTIAAVHGDGSTVWAVGERGAMLRSTDSGVTWVPVESGVVESLNGIDGAGSLVVVVGSGGIVLRSRDGATFDKRSIAPSVSFVDVAVTTKTVFAVSIDGRVWRSTNEGDSFTALASLQAGVPRAIAIAPSGVYVGTTEGLYRSRDDGATFTQIVREPVYRIEVRGDIVHALAGATVVYPSLQICGSCVDASYSFAALYRTRDGKTWERRTLDDPTTTSRSWGAPTPTAPPQSPPKGTARGFHGLGTPNVRGFWGPTSLSIGPAGEIYALSHQLYVSTDGTTFSTKKAPGGAVWAGSKLLAFGAGLAWSPDRGESWQSVTSASDVVVGRMAAMPDGRIVAVASGGALLVRDKGWSKVALPITKHQRPSSVFALDAHHVIVAGDDGMLLQSTDGGRTFAHRASDSTQDLASVWGIGDDVFVSGRETLLHSRDRGRTWDSIRAKGYSMGQLWGTSRDDLWLLGWSGVKHSTDRGHTWREVDPKLGGVFHAIWGRGPNDLFIVGMEGKVMHSRDRGKTWTPRTSGTTKDLHAIWGQGDHVFAIGGGSVVLHSSDRGTTWSEELVHAELVLDSIAATKDSIFIAGSGSILRRKL